MKEPPGSTRDKSRRPRQPTSSALRAHLDQHRRVREGVVEHGQHVGGGHHAGVVTPGGDQQPVVDLGGEKAEEQQADLTMGGREKKR